jgi:hypothetical protein
MSNRKLKENDVTFYEEWNYIFITLKELISVIKTRNK